MSDVPPSRACRLLVRGRVQGVNFRNFARAKALSLGLSGYTRNLQDGSTVEVYVEGREEALRSLIAQLHRGPPLARVEAVEEHWAEPRGERQGFRIEL